MSETLKEGLLKRGRYSIGEMFYRSVEFKKRGLLVKKNLTGFWVQRHIDVAKVCH